MIKLFNDIKDGGYSRELLEAESILKYGLHLSYDLDEEVLKGKFNEEDPTSFINYIVHKAWRMAYPLFWGELVDDKWVNIDLDTHVDGGGRWNFFGNFGVSMEGEYCLASAMERDEKFWKKTIMNQGVVSTLFTLRKNFLDKEERLTSYSMANVIREHGSSYIRKNYIDDDGKLQRKKNGEQKERGTESGKAPDFARNFDSFYPKVAGELQGYWWKEKGTKGNDIFRFSSPDAEYLSFLYENRSYITGIIKKANDKDKIGSIKDYFTELDILEKNLKATSKTKCNADSIMLQYQFERDFNYFLVRDLIKLLIVQKSKYLQQIEQYIKIGDGIRKRIDKLRSMGEDIKRIEQLESEKKVYDTLIHELKERGGRINDVLSTDMMMMIFNLPNVYSRNLYLKIAIDAFNVGHYDENYYLDKENPVNAYRESLGRTLSGIDHDYKWIELYKKFFQFMSKVVFPVYERCFFLVYKKALCLVDKDNEKWIDKGINILETYLNDHAEIVYLGGIKEDEVLRSAYLGEGDKKEFVRSIIFAEKNWEAEYDKLELADKKGYDLLMRKVLKLLPEINNLSSGENFDANYFKMTERDNRNVYKKFLDCHLKARGI